jgi:hypothetical protein
MMRWVGGRGEVVVAAGQGGRDPQQVDRGVGDDLHVHPVAAVLLRKIGLAVADTVALGACAVEQDVVGVGLPQDPQQSGRRWVRWSMTAVA